MPLVILFSFYAALLLVLTVQLSAFAPQAMAPRGQDARPKPFDGRTRP